jgi:3',5'-cyclic AMP phosphodiesterase CpdA
MRTIIHLSDLHFGRIRPDLLDPLVKIINSAAPDLVVVSGDLTQRARVAQFGEARAFLDRIAAPRLVVPGNHDVPLDNVAMRAFAPWSRYRRWISTDLNPVFEDEEIAVAGVNTVNPLYWQRGRIGDPAVARIRSAFSDSDERRVHIVVAHHPFAQASEERKALMRGAPAAAVALAQCGADVILSGHLHVWRAAPHAPQDDRSRAMLMVQAGTGLSTRVRGDDNDFNLLRIEPDEIIVERFVATAGVAAFTRVQGVRFRRTPDGWRPANKKDSLPNAALVEPGRA